MNSIDTNVFLYGVNTDCPEYRPCRKVIESALESPESWVISDQVWFELYRLLRNPRVMEKPLSAVDAYQVVYWFRENSGFHHCAWEDRLMEDLFSYLRQPSFPARQVFDLVLAITLRENGVKRFYTRNVKDFAPLGFFEVIDPTG